jgi:hypothetical protein
MVRELSRLDPLFKDAVLPPCFTRGNFTGCVYTKEMQDRLSHADPNPPCPLYLNQTSPGRNAVEDRVQVWADGSHEMSHWFHSRAAKYSKLWNRDAFTGERLPVA